MATAAEQILTEIFGITPEIIEEIETFEDNEKIRLLEQQPVKHLLFISYILYKAGNYIPAWGDEDDTLLMKLYLKKYKNEIQQLASRTITKLNKQKIEKIIKKLPCQYTEKEIEDSIPEVKILEALNGFSASNFTKLLINYIKPEYNKISKIATNPPSTLYNYIFIWKLEREINKKTHTNLKKQRKPTLNYKEIPETILDELKTEAGLWDVEYAEIMRLVYITLLNSAMKYFYDSISNEYIDYRDFFYKYYRETTSNN